jgi:hypothetical protein
LLQFRGNFLRIQLPMTTKLNNGVDGSGAV